MTLSASEGDFLVRCIDFCKLGHYSARNFGIRLSILAALSSIVDFSATTLRKTITQNLRSVPNLCFITQVYKTNNKTAESVRIFVNSWDEWPRCSLDTQYVCHSQSCSYFGRPVTVLVSICTLLSKCWAASCTTHVWKVKMCRPIGKFLCMIFITVKHN